MFRSVFEGFETFLYVPATTSPSGVHIHDSIDTKRTMSVVILALVPALLFGMYNVGYQHYLAIGELSAVGFWTVFFFGFLAVLPKIIVSYVVGLGIEFVVAQWRGHRGHGLCRDFCQGGFWRHRHEYLQRGSCHAGIPLLCLSLEDVGR